MTKTETAKNEVVADIKILVEEQSNLISEKLSLISDIEGLEETKKSLAKDIVSANNELEAIKKQVSEYSEILNTEIALKEKTLSSLDFIVKSLESSVNIAKDSSGAAANYITELNKSFEEVNQNSKTYIDTVKKTSDKLESRLQDVTETTSTTIAKIEETLTKNIQKDIELQNKEIALNERESKTNNIIGKILK